MLSRFDCCSRFQSTKLKLQEDTQVEKKKKTLTHSVQSLGSNQDNSDSKAQS